MRYQQCVKCVMDTTDPKISFSEDGVCSHCLQFEEMKKTWDLKGMIRSKAFSKMIEKIKEKGKGKKYDCLIGLSGGVDSSYIAYLAHENGLRPLCVHLDNGWNSELAVANIHTIVEKFGFDLVTHVIDWSEFKDLQRSFFKADVIDIEFLSDHAIFGVIIELAKKNKIKSILSGANISTEYILPKAWVHRKQDLTNILDINKKFGTKPLKTFPQVSTLKHVIFMYGQGYKVFKPLNLLNYNKADAMKILQEKISWRNYGGKHHESIFTKFYQAYILPKKFNVDKRKAHLSTLINSGQMSRDEAVQELKKPFYDAQELENDKKFVLKKLGFSEKEFENYIARNPIPHLEYASDQWIYNFLYKVSRIIKWA